MSDDLDNMLDALAREGQDELDREHGQHILDALDADKSRQGFALLESINRARLAMDAERGEQGG